MYNKIFKEHYDEVNITAARDLLSCDSKVVFYLGTTLDEDLIQISRHGRILGLDDPCSPKLFYKLARAGFITIKFQ